MRYVIIGGVAAGMSAAMQIVRNKKDPEIITLESGGFYSYAQCGLPYIIGGEVEDTNHLIARDVQTFRDKYGIDARVYHHVTEVDTKQQIVKGEDLERKQSFEISYDKLLVASGGSPVLPDWPGHHLQGVHTLKTIPHVQHILNDLNHAQDITIVGGGYIGLELAENLIESGHRVRLIERNNRLAKMFDENMTPLVHDEATKHDVELCVNESVVEISGDKRVESVTTDKNHYQTDMVIAATGIKPNTDFLKHTGIHKYDNGAIIVNPYMETNIENVYAAGDCATQFHRIKQKDDYVPLGTHANKQGRVAGQNLAGEAKAFQGIVGTSILRFFDLTLAKTGLSEKEAAALNFPYETVLHQGSDIAGYFHDKKPLHMKMIYRTDTNIVIGGQVIGESGADKRIDVLATAIFHQMTISDFEDLDLSYAPPYNGVWDPLQQTARRAK
ncbi:NADPH-dependent 2,4-dienoyl-CoA reductase/sulfur reductase-like enzyme [Salibacterium salarium]|uniref:FAD-dependent oxidoreductase n=1 Tax=Salibacterium salarium TaxID=284579 RepID=UPI00277D3991|nr:FAD-dependent oxidoreductase [Salibacterium salarium]MDQ0297810.1 NADPH-dependent 2,4-dienoyl-CoA reductase/sulfur reductase-like enzyme [Salibacterium salarium]